MEGEEHKEIEKKIEKTNERISTCAGIGIAALAAAMAGAPWFLFIAACAAGGVGGTAVHEAKKWMKNRKRRKQI